eukprot:12397685-Karenia_brevis.AAC.1
MHQSRLLVFRRSVKGNVGLFTVAKKNGDQRLIVDGRLPNLAFEEPDTVQLASGEVFGRLEANPGEPPEVAEADIE